MKVNIVAVEEVASYLEKQEQTAGETLIVCAIDMDKYGIDIILDKNLGFYTCHLNSDQMSYDQNGKMVNSLDDVIQYISEQITNELHREQNRISG